MSVMIINKFKSPKWESKVIGIQWMQEWIIENNNPPDLTEYAFRVLKGAMKEWKETNSNLTKAASEWINNILKTAKRLGRRSIAIVIPYLWEKLTDKLVMEIAMESVILWAELNFNSIGSISYTIKQLKKYGPKTVSPTVLKEIFSWILLIIDSFGTEGIQLNEIFKFIVFGWGHKAIEVRNEAILVIKQLYNIYGYNIHSYLNDIKPSTMTVINQELESIELPDHLKAKKEEEDDDLLASPTKRNQNTWDDEEEEEKEETPHIYVSPSPEMEETENSENDDNSHDNFSVSSSGRTSQKSKKSVSSFSKTLKKSRKSSRMRKEMIESEEKEYLEILDIGNKELRDKKDLKTIWTPGELRVDVIQHIKTQIKSAFGAKIEKQCFSSNFKDHIQWLKLFESCFEADYQQTDYFFNIIDLILKWIFIKGCEGSNTNTKFLIEILNFLESLLNFLDIQAYELMEAEGIILITFLVEKVNNSNSSIRETIKDLIFKVSSNEALYPPKAAFKLIMAGVKSKNAKIKKEWLEIISELLDEIQEELYSPKDVKFIIKEVDSHDKNTRSNALEAWVSIYKLIGDSFWKLAGKNTNQKVKDLITSKFSTIPKSEIHQKKASKLSKSLKSTSSKEEERKAQTLIPSHKSKPLTQSRLKAPWTPSTNRQKSNEKSNTKPSFPKQTQGKTFK